MPAAGATQALRIAAERCRSLGMNRNFQIVVLLSILCSSVFGQDETDAERLASMSYMKYSSTVNCDSTSGTNLEHKICLNLEFQRVDSILNHRFDLLVSDIENDSIREQLMSFQKHWAKNRRMQSVLVTEGLGGHSAGIYYLRSMIKSTELRIEELENLKGLR